HGTHFAGRARSRAGQPARAWLPAVGGGPYPAGRAGAVIVARSATGLADRSVPGDADDVADAERAVSRALADYRAYTGFVGNGGIGIGAIVIMGGSTPRGQAGSGTGPENTGIGQVGRNA